MCSLSSLITRLAIPLLLYFARGTYRLDYRVGVRLLYVCGPSAALNIRIAFERGTCRLKWAHRLRRTTNCYKSKINYIILFKKKMIHKNLSIVYTPDFNVEELKTENDNWIAKTQELYSENEKLKREYGKMLRLIENKAKNRFS